MVTLSVKERGEEKPAVLRRKGLMPAVMYGKGEESTSIAIDARTFSKVFREAGESTVITLEGVGEEKQALIHDVSFDPVRDEPIHADFYLIAKGQKVTVGVPLEFTGVSPAVKDLGGILVKVIHTLEIEVLPKDLPHSIEVDISKLATLESKITVGDLKLPESAKPQVPLDEAVAMIDVPKDEPEEPAEAPDLSQIETSVERGKKEEEGGEAPAEGAKEEKKKEEKK